MQDYYLLVRCMSERGKCSRNLTGLNTATLASRIDPLAPSPCDQDILAHGYILTATFLLINFWPTMRNEPNQNTGVSRVIPKQIHVHTHITTWKQWSSCSSTSTLCYCYQYIPSTLYYVVHFFNRHVVKE